MVAVNQISFAAPNDQGLLTDYLVECRELVLGELRQIVPANSVYADVLYNRMLEYPLRGAKALRPALCVACCRALGGMLEGVLKTAAVLELYHNAFLIHDDVEDRSEKRRNELTLHRMYGVPIAVNIGDAMLALALTPLLENMGILGMGKALRILRAVSQMARESAEGQAVELEWVRQGRWQMRDAEYLRMAYKKTTWYSFVAPVELAGLVVGAEPLVRFRLRRFATALGGAFQIQDDLLNLRADEGGYGKEILGDLWEGKHTLILAHALRHATVKERARAVPILQKLRPPIGSVAGVSRRLSGLVSSGQMSEQQRDLVEQVLAQELGWQSYKTAEDVQFLFSLIQQYDSCRYAEAVAHRRALRAQHSLEQLRNVMPNSVHLDFLQELVQFVVDRDY